MGELDGCRCCLCSHWYHKQDAGDDLLSRGIDLYLPVEDSHRRLAVCPSCLATMQASDIDAYQECPKRELEHIQDPQEGSPQTCQHVTPD